MGYKTGKPLKRQKLRNNEYYGMQGIQDELYAKSKEGLNFNHLMELILMDENLLLAYRNIKNNGGSQTQACDKLTIKDIEKLSNEQYLSEMKKRFANYRPKLVRRKEIPKPNGKTRPLGIPSIWDRLVQQAVLQILEPICEAKFHESSYGFRPSRSTEHAIANVYKRIQRDNLHFVVDIDIRGFFDNVNHSKLMKQLWTMGIRDKQLLCIIKKMLKAPIRLPDGSMEWPTKGTPQGGILSPLLSNVVLNELDWWIDGQWQGRELKSVKPRWHPNGSQHQSHTFTAMRKTNLKEMYIVRYADDFKIFCRKRSDANKVFIAVKQWLNERLKLAVSDEKSKVTNLKKSYTEFLGFKLKAVPKSGKYVVRAHMCDKAVKRVSDELVEQIKRVQHSKGDRAKAIWLYNSKVIGIHQYYRLATHISLDMTGIARRVDAVWKNRLKGIIKKGKPDVTAKKLGYATSAQARWFEGQIIYPVGYCKTKNPMNKKRSINSFTEDGRAEIHKAQQAVSVSDIQYLLRNPIRDRSTQYNDNRLSRYVGQLGKDAVTGLTLDVRRIHVHHVMPTSMEGTDEYDNLTIVDKDVHILIHATKPETIAEYIIKLSLSAEQLRKLNKLRRSAGKENL